MKKKIGLILVLFIALFTLTGCGKSGKDYYAKYNHLNFKETLDAEEMQIENTEYTEADDQVTIYLFRGQGCNFCRKFLTFLNSISKEYGKYFKLVSFEVWYDEANNALWKEVPNVTEVEARGVPYIIIGDKVFDGYTEEYNDAIKTKIMEQYQKKTYDAFDKLANYNSGFKGFSITEAIIINAVLVSVAAVAIIANSNKNARILLENINSKEKKEIKKPEKKEVKTETKKATKKETKKKA